MFEESASVSMNDKCEFHIQNRPPVHSTLYTVHPVHSTVLVDHFLRKVGSFGSYEISESVCCHCSVSEAVGA